MYTLLASYKTWGFNWKARHRSLIRVLLIPSPQPANRRKTESNLGVWGSAAPPNLQTINIPLWIGVWCEGRADHGDFPLDDIDFRKYERKYERMIGRQWVSLNSLNCKMFLQPTASRKTNIWYFFLFYQTRCKKNYHLTVRLSSIKSKQFGNIKLRYSGCWCFCHYYLH